MAEQNFNEMFDVVKHVTLPQLKLEAGTPVFVRITGPIYQADPVSPTRNRTPADGTAPLPPMAPPKLVHIDNLVTKQPQQMIVNEVVGSELEKNYPDTGYVGKCFKITLLNIQGKRYKGAEVIEIKLKAPAETTTTEAAAPAKGRK